LVGLAQRSTNYQTWHNVMIGGKRMRSQLVEDNTMWSVLTTSSFEPLIEFDMCGPDIFELLGQPQVRTRAHGERRHMRYVRLKLLEVVFF
jgi:hypothetical protein